MGLSEQKPIKNFGEKRAWAYTGTVTLNSASDYRTNGLYRTPNPNPNPGPLVR